MLWFKKKQSNEQKIEERVMPLLEQHESAIEIVSHKQATHEAKKDIEQANAKLKEIFDRNHFTIKIYLAAGGRKPKGNTK